MRHKVAGIGVREGSSPPFLLVIRHGPYYGLDVLAHFGKTFGNTFQGELCTFGPQRGELTFGSFRVLRFPLRDGSGTLERLIYGFRVLTRAWRARFVLGRSLVVIAYDPFQSGIFALLAKWTAGAKFICEVNGSYDNPANLIEIGDPCEREKKRLRMVKFGSFVLRRADLIKVLYPGQIEGFNLSGAPPPQTCFFDLVNDHVFRFLDSRPEDRLLFIGHPFLLKGVDILLDAFSRVRSDFPHWELVVVGWRIEEAARARDHSFEQVRFLGPQPAEALAQLMASSKAVVLASRSEGLPRVLLEAALMGRARIASKVGGIPMAIEDGVDGMLFRSEDVDELEQKLRRFMSDPEMVVRMGMAARKRAEKEFTSMEYLRLYEEAVGAISRRR